MDRALAIRTSTKRMTTIWDKSAPYVALTEDAGRTVETLMSLRSRAAGSKHKSDGGSN
jgi:hypothetical protein